MLMLSSSTSFVDSIVSFWWALYMEKELLVDKLRRTIRSLVEGKVS